MTIYCAVSLNKEEKSLLRRHLGGASVVFFDELEEQERRQEFLKASVCFGNPPSEWLEQTGRLQWIQLESAGFGEYQDIDPRSDFAMTNLQGFFDIPVAESALAGILALYRKVDTLVQLQQQQEWIGQNLRPRMKTLAGSKVCILGGSGGIGGHLVELLKPFHTGIIIFGKRSPKADIKTLPELENVLPSLDILVSSLPETDETIGILNEKRLKMLPDHALFVNVGRGSVVDEPALTSLLQERQLGGAVLDVTGQEPLPSGHPLWTCPNTLITQHTGGGFNRESIGKVEFFLRNLERFRSRAALENLVNLEKGY